MPNSNKHKCFIVCSVEFTPNSQKFQLLRFESYNLDLKNEEEDVKKTPKHLAKRTRDWFNYLDSLLNERIKVHLNAKNSR